MDPRPPIGAVVLFRIGGENETPDLRPATVVTHNPKGGVNLNVQTDGQNDQKDLWKAGVLDREFAPVPPTFHQENVAEGRAVGEYRPAAVAATDALDA